MPPDDDDLIGDLFSRDPPSSRGKSLFDRPRPQAKVPVPPPLPSVPVPPPYTPQCNVGQLQAVEEVIDWRFDPRAPRYFKLTGPAGTGKTFVTKKLRERLRGTRTSWSGMTGKAALRLRESIGIKTTTFHGAIYHPPREVDNALESKIDLDFSDVKRGDSYDMLLVVDEASMVSPKLRADADRSPFEKILLVGDWIQIPAVLSRAEEAALGSEDYSVFTGIAGPHLTRVMRNGGAVLAAATEIRERQSIPTSSAEFGNSRYDYVETASPDAAIRTAVDSYLADPLGHTLITWRNEPRISVNRIIRLRLGHAGDLPDVGEPLVVRKNIHKLGLMNGDVVRCEEVCEEGPTIAGIPTRYFWVTEEASGKQMNILVPVGDFSGILPYVGLDVWRKALKEAKVDDVVPLTFAYVLTAHLAQGSQYRRVTTFLPGDLRHPHFMKMTRLPDGQTMGFGLRLVYTALSRAQAHTSLIVSR
jgi:ATP-dependent exoDNAse (exonuclease V) alpha subunit